VPRARQPKRTSRFGANNDRKPIDELNSLATFGWSCNLILSDSEYAALAAAMRAAATAGIWPPAISAVCFLAVTGWRSGEATALMWSQVDLDRRTAILAETKTGRSVRPLSRIACEVLDR
jgi:integrase